MLTAIKTENKYSFQFEVKYWKDGTEEQEVKKVEIKYNYPELFDLNKILILCSVGLKINARNVIEINRL